MAARASAASAKRAVKVTAIGVPRSVQISVVVALVAGFFLIKPYLGTVLLSGLIAFIFNPVYKKVLRRTGRPGMAIWATLLTALLSLVIPLLLVLLITISQAHSIINKFESGNVSVGPAQIERVVQQGTNRVETIIHALPGGEKFTPDKQKITDQLKQLAGDLVQGIVNAIKNASGAFFGFITTTILALVLIINMLRYQTELIAFIKRLSPFHDTVNNVYLQRTAAMTKAMVKGQLIIATAQGTADALILWIVGVNYFWFFLVFLIFLSFIPLGGGILVIPIGIIMMLTGHIATGLLVILFHILVVGNIDNVLRPRLVPKTAQSNSALTLLSVFSGLVLFGAIGIIYGPVLMILLITTLKMYAEHNRTSVKPLPPQNL
jgi:predicted PurR-regulated permease PerM